MTQNQDAKMVLRRHGEGPINQGDTIYVGVYAVLTGDGSKNTVSAADVNLRWDPESLRLKGGHQEGAPPTQYAGFTQSGCLAYANDANPPTTGEGYYTIWLALGTPATIPAGDEGLLLTTFEFDVLVESGQTAVEVFGHPEPWTFKCGEEDDPNAGDWRINLSIYDGETPAFNLLSGYENVTLDIGDTTEPPAPEDILLAIIVDHELECGCGSLKLGNRTRDWILGVKKTGAFK